MEGLGYRFDIGSQVVPVDGSAGALTGHRIHLKNYDAVAFVVALGAAASGTEDVVLDLQQADAATGGTIQDLDTIDHYYRKAEAVLDGDETWTKVTQTAASEVTIAGASFAAQQVIVVIEVSADALADGFEWVSLNVADIGTVARLISVVAVMHNLAVQRAPANLAQPNA